MISNDNMNSDLYLDIRKRVINVVNGIEDRLARVERVAFFCNEVLESYLCNSLISMESFDINEKKPRHDLKTLAAEAVKEINRNGPDLPQRITELKFLTTAVIWGSFNKGTSEEPIDHLAITNTLSYLGLFIQHVPVPGGGFSENRKWVAVRGMLMNILFETNTRVKFGCNEEVLFFFD